MLKKLALSCMAVLALAAAKPAMAQIETSAKQAIIVDVNTGAVLLDKNADEKMPTSSMSKIMTIYMVFEDIKRGNIKLDDTLLVSEKAWRMQGSKMFIKVGDRVPVESLIQGVIIQSGNDASVALAEGLGGTEDAFVDAMNARAKELGMNNSHFMNASGWPVDNHYSTARDLALLAYRVMTDFPEYYHYFSEPDYTYNKIHQKNRDPLIGRVQGADGLKTGHTEIGGYGLMGSAMRDGRRVIVVLNGLASEKDRAEEGARLTEWALRNFDEQTVAKKDEPVGQADVWLGKQDKVPLVLNEDVKVLVSRADRNEVKLTPVIDKQVEAPVSKGDQIGTLRIEQPGQPVIEKPMFAAASVERMGVFGRTQAYVEKFWADHTQHD
jgi:D-alanyl-D-alanine carboxypeptidase (penicillin-binding protein 5/6)